MDQADIELTEITYSKRLSSFHSSAMAPKTRQSKEPPKGLRDLVHDRLLKDVLEGTAEKWPGWKVLVVDKGAMRVMSTAVGMYDLMEQHVTLVEDITKKRAPFPDMAAIYLIAAKEESVKRMIADFLPTETRKKPLYGAAFVYFLGRMPDRILMKIKQCKPLLRHIKGLGEVNLDFLAKESNGFHLDMRRCFAPMYKQPGSGVEKKIAQKLVTVCATLNEYPHVRYRGDSDVCTQLAKSFHQQMTDFIGCNDQWWYHGDATHNKTERSTLLLLDRKDDCLTPCMHEFTYQSMVTDLLPIKEDRIKYQSDTVDKETGKPIEMETLLNDNDSVWVELRGKHIADVIQTLSTKIRDMMESNTTKAVAKKGSKPLSLAQMASALKELPEYREVMSKLAQHMHISHQCMDIFNKRGLLDLSDLEQTLATGQTDEGIAPKLNELVDQMEEALKNTKDLVSRIRLMLIMTVSQKGITAKDRERLLAVAKLSPRDIQVIDNLEKLGLPVISEETGSKIGSMFGSGPKAAAGSGEVEEESEYSSSRYKCPMKTLLEQLCSGDLSIDEYPSVMPLPVVAVSGMSQVTSARNRPKGGSVKSKGSKTGRWSRTSVSDKKKGYAGGRQIVFMTGGMTFSELRSVHEVVTATGKEIYAGSTAYISPTEFVEDLASLGK